MKTNIHPKLNMEARVSCACGNTFTATSTKDEIHVEVCHKCHPFFTGEHRFIDTRGRVEHFQRKQKAAEEIKVKYQDRKARKEKKGEHEPKSLRELLGEV